MHLLRNATSYTPNGGKIHFRLEGNRQKEMFHILIYNTGKRIPEEIRLILEANEHQVLIRDNSASGVEEAESQ